jgi:hypothetical protein
MPLRLRPTLQLALHALQEVVVEDGDRQPIGGGVQLVGVLTAEA